MATRSNIAIKREDGKLRVVYCHWDGYPDHVGRILVENYDTPEKIEALLDMGNLSVLGKSIEKPEGHSFATPVKDHCVFYDRDRGEANQEARIYPSKLNWKFGEQGEEYQYLFENGKWQVRSKKGQFFNIQK